MSQAFIKPNNQEEKQLNKFYKKYKKIEGQILNLLQRKNKLSNNHPKDKNKNLNHKKNIKLCVSIAN